MGGVGGTVAEPMWWVGRLRSLCGGWLYGDYNASLSSNWTELDWTGTELGNCLNKDCLGPSLEDPKSQFCHAAAKKCCGSGNSLICCKDRRVYKEYLYI